MAVLKNKDAKLMASEEREEKLRDLRLELVKKSTSSGKGGKIKNKEIKKAIARILTLNKALKEAS